jgi:predicted TIM-barrel fold metal-dependent hydrolase
MPRFIMDAHVHAQRWSPGLIRRGEAFNYRNLEKAIMNDTPWDNSRALLQDMDRLGIAMAVLNIAFNQRNEMILAQIEKYPDRFVGFTGPVDTQRKAYFGKQKYDADKAARECDYWLSKKGFVGIGEMVSVLPDPDIDVSIDDNLKKMIPLMEVAQQHKAPILIHTGCISYPKMCRLRAVDPVLIDDLAVRFPDVAIIVGHMGTNSSFTNDLPDRARQLAARHEHVYLETCQAMHDQIERAYLDPQIGADKLVFGSDWGASISYHRVEGKVYAGTPFGKPPKTLVHHQDWATRQMDKIEMPEEDRAKILGLNLAKLCKIDVEKRLWAEQEKYGPQINSEAVPEVNEWEQRPVGSNQ